MLLGLVPPGFLNANVDRFSKSPANYGLMDILAALHWIQENIEAFGGDNKSVTLAGHGTGAACVHFLIASQAVPDGLLFHRAILMSGSGLAPWSLVGDPAHYAAIVAHHVNCSVDLPHQALMKCLREVSLRSLLSTPIRMPEFGNAFGPSVDGVVIGELNQCLVSLIVAKIRIKILELSQVFLFNFKLQKHSRLFILVVPAATNQTAVELSIMKLFIV